MKNSDVFIAWSQSSPAVMQSRVAGDEFLSFSGAIVVLNTLARHFQVPVQLGGGE